MCIVLTRKCLHVCGVHVGGWVCTCSSSGLNYCILISTNRLSHHSLCAYVLEERVMLQRPDARCWSTPRDFLNSPTFSRNCKWSSKRTIMSSKIFFSYSCQKCRKQYSFFLKPIADLFIFKLLFPTIDSTILVYLTASRSDLMLNMATHDQVCNHKSRQRPEEHDMQEFHKSSSAYEYWKHCNSVDRRSITGNCHGARLCRNQSG